MLWKEVQWLQGKLKDEYTTIPDSQASSKLLECVFLRCLNTTLLINLAVGSIYLHIIYWLHKPWCCHKECRISHPSSCWNDLTTTPVQRLRCNLRINYFELNISYRFVAKWTFSGTPLESAQNNPLLKSQKLYQ